MKRLWMLLAVLSLLLCSCNTEPSGAVEDSTQNSTEETFSFSGMINQIFSNEDTCVVTVAVTINPEFRIDLNSKNKILDIKCRNQDAEKLLEDVHVVGMSYEEGMPMILAAAYEMGFLTADTTEIKVEITVCEQLDDGQAEELTMTLKEPLIRFQEEKELAVDVIVSDIQDDIRIVEANVISAEDGSFSGNSYSYYKNKKLIKWEAYRIDGGYTCRLYGENDNPTKMFWSDSGSNGEEYYDEDGNRTMRKTWYHDTEMFGDIIYSERTYWPNGNNRSLEQRRANGPSLSETYDENGRCIESKQKFPPDYVRIEDTPDGLHVETTFYENGTIKTQVWDYPDGRHVEETNYENGKCKTRITISPNGERKEASFDENGNFIE